MPSMPNPTSNPIQKLRIIRLRKQASILARSLTLTWNRRLWLLILILSLCRLLNWLLTLLPPLFLGPALSIAIVQQESKDTSKPENDKTLQDIRINVVFIIRPITSWHLFGGFVVVYFGFIERVEFGL